MVASKAKSSPATATPDREIVVSRLFDAPRELVWAAWTDPEQVVEWWGPKGFTTTIHEMDVRPGGTWRHTMHGPDGADYPNKSVFIEVTKPERIVYSHGGGKQGAVGASFEATWTFAAQGDKGDKTLLTIRMVFASAKDRDHVVKQYNAIEGGKQTLGRLAEHLEGMPVVIERTLNAPVARVWQALTDLAQMKQWYFPQLDAFKPEVGFETRVDVEHEGKVYIHFWKVTEVIPNRKIAYSWKYKDVPGDSLVSFELFPAGEKTRLKLTHTGLGTFDPKTNPDYASKNFFQGWTHFSGALAGFVEKPAAPSAPGGGA
jgi:uncharacterized protein YndB with AHSA1/START domain